MKNIITAIRYLGLFLYKNMYRNAQKSRSSRKQLRGERREFSLYPDNLRAAFLLYRNFNSGAHQLRAGFRCILFRSVLEFERICRVGVKPAQDDVFHRSLAVSRLEQEDNSLDFVCGIWVGVLNSVPVNIIGAGEDVIKLAVSLYRLYLLVIHVEIFRVIFVEAEPELSVFGAGPASEHRNADYDAAHAVVFVARLVVELTLPAEGVRVAGSCSCAG